MVLGNFPFIPPSAGPFVPRAAPPSGPGTNLDFTGGGRSGRSNSNPFLDFLEQNPEAVFQSFIPKNASRQQQRFGAGLFDTQRKNFLGSIGRDIQAGGTGTQTFSDFLSKNFDFGTEQAFGDPIAAGRAKFSGPARFLLRQ